METLNRRDTGYRGIWYMNQPSGDEYVYKYSGGLGTYCAKHQPFAVYSEEAHKTFFCYGGSTRDDSQHLLEMVSCFDHATGEVPRPTILLDKETDDAHDNPVISLDHEGFVWVFSTSHGTSRPSYIHKSIRPYDIDAFELIPATRIVDGRPISFDNFSYMQVWRTPDRGFTAFLTHYRDPAIRTIFHITSQDGVAWSRWQRLAAIEEGHYQVSAAGEGKIASASNVHPSGKGVNWRTNLYYLESSDNGCSWHSADGQSLDLPLTDVQNPALVHDYLSEGLNVYLKDIRFDSAGHPILLYLTSLGYESGPGNDPRTWTTARWTGSAWEIRPAMQSDNNYDMGSLYLVSDGHWKVIAPTETGPQPYNPGGEVSMWETEDHGATWVRTRQLTSGSARNHTYVRRPVNAHRDFYALWADGHARKPSGSSLYFCNADGDVFLLPDSMEGGSATPSQVR